MEQRSAEWFEGRARRITASRFGDVMAAPTSDRHRDLLGRLVDGIRDVPMFEHEAEAVNGVAPWHQHGRDWEGRARWMYEEREGLEVQEVGLLVHPRFPFVAGSPDGLVGDEGGIEIKCHRSLAAYQASAAGGLPTVYVPQVQGYLWITGRKWWDYCNYFEVEREGKRTALMTVHRVLPDAHTMGKIERACVRFWEKANKIAGGLGG